MGYAQSIKEVSLKLAISASVGNSGLPLWVSFSEGSCSQPLVFLDGSNTCVQVKTGVPGSGATPGIGGASGDMGDNLQPVDLGNGRHALDVSSKLSQLASISILDTSATHMFRHC